ncbi:uncharacterized protein [Diadema setosum]|uniref:uncharacterized protein n=1 Tax=Diadema setosum TaxID=31175 RepID=UPI003B3A1D50
MDVNARVQFDSSDCLCLNHYTDEEDVFECGRCKQKFTDMTVFMQHKKDKSCQKLRKPKAGDSDHQSSQAVGDHVVASDVLDGILMSDADSQAISQMQDVEEGNGNISSVSPSISELFTTKASDKEGVSSQLTLDILNALTATNKQVLDPATGQCDLSQEWMSNQEGYESHPEEKNNSASQADLTSFTQITPPDTHSQKRHHTAHEHEELNADTSHDSKADTSVRVSSRRKRPDHSCKPCNLNFLSRFKLEQHLSTRKHRNALKNQKGDKDTPVTRKRKGRPAKRGLCKLCGTEVSSAKELQQHMRDEHRQDYYRSQQNNAGAERQGGDTDDSTNLCRECGIMVATRSLLRHERRCANRKRYECPLCRHQSRERTEYKSHIESHKVWIEIDRTHFQNPSSNKDFKKPRRSKRQSNSHPSRRNDEGAILGSSNQNLDRENKMTLSPVDLAALGLMPKRQLNSTAGDECLDAFTSSVSEAAHRGDREGGTEQQNDSEDVQTADSDEEEEEHSSSVKVNSRQLKCKVCVKWFLRKSLSKHMYEQHNMVKQFQCRDLKCLETFVDIDTFSAHITSHSDKLMFQCCCRHCMRHTRDVEVEYKEGIRKWRMRQYYAQLSFKCSVCWMKFPSQDRLQKHLDSNPHKHTCEECGKLTVSKRQLRLHMESHQDARGYLCDICGGGFKTDRDLKKHMASHSTKRPFTCDECGKGFLFKNKLTRHFNTVHSKQKPFSCDHPGCGKTFARKDKLSDHQNSHMAVRPFACKFCQKSFYRKDSARDHEILYHTKDYPYSCKLCDKGFLRPKALENHQTQEHTKDVLLIADSLLNPQTSSVAQTVKSITSKPSAVSYVLLNDSQSLTLQSIDFSQSSTSDVPSSDLTYTMSDISGNGVSALTYQMPGITLPDASNIQVIAQVLPDGQSP